MIKYLVMTIIAVVWLAIGRLFIDRYYSDNRNLLETTLIGILLFCPILFMVSFEYLP